MEPVVVVATGVANTASVSAAIRRCGFECVFSDDPDRVRRAARVVLPGVGSFEAGMQRLSERGLVGVLRDRAIEGRPLLAICLGLQLLCSTSEESPGVDGLGVIDAPVRRLPPGVLVPHFGWNLVDASRSPALTSGYAYFANSYCLAAPPDGWAAATTTHGVEFVAALERGPVLACQFHPELSGAYGSALIGRWLARQQEGVAC
jgi:imidazole glycerol-phosphate synthase subunit HisH